MRLILVLTVSWFLAVAGRDLVNGQESGAQRRPQPAALPEDAEVFRYDPEGLRDPFVRVSEGGDALPEQPFVTAASAGWSADRVVLRGIVRSRGEYLALVQTADGRNQVLRAGDRVGYGFVRSIGAQTLTIDLGPDDPHAPVPGREVIKRLRGAEGQQ